jgi:hypothetical protein
VDFNAEKLISTWLAEELSTILSFSKPKQRNKYRPQPNDDFTYQKDVSKSGFEKMCTKMKERSHAGYALMLTLDEYKNYINDPFDNTTTMTYLMKTSPHQNVSGPKNERCHPPYGITYESSTFNVRTIENGQRRCDVWHYSAYLLVPRLVYHLSTKLRNDAIHNQIGKKEEVGLILFLTRHGYAT